MSEQLGNGVGRGSGPDGNKCPQSQCDWHKALRTIPKEVFGQETAGLRSELLQYRALIFKIQLAAPAIGLVILQQLTARVGRSESDSERVVYVVFFAGAVSFLLVLALLLLNKLHRAMIQQVGYLLHVARSPWEMSLAWYRKAPQKDVEKAAKEDNPPGGRFGAVSFVTHAVLIALAELWACYSVCSAVSPLWLWVLYGLLLVTILGSAYYAVRDFRKLKKYRELVDNAWFKLWHDLPKLSSPDSQTR